MTLTQQVIICDRGSAASGRFKVSPRAEYLCIKKLLQAVFLLGLTSPCQWLQHSVKTNRTLLLSEKREIECNICQHFIISK